MVLENISVIHKSFGEGVLTEQSGKYITVDFKEAKKKKFVYPDSFENFLTFKDESFCEQLAIDIAASKAARHQIIDKKNEENLRAMTRGIVIPGKEAVVGEGEEEENRFKENEEI